MSWTRKRKKFSRPRKMFDIIRIKEENALVKKYGLKSKKEIWKADSAIARVRSLAKTLITAEIPEQEKLLKKLKNMGFKTSKIANVLDLDKEDWLKRRLQSILIERKLAKPKEARQLIAHKHVSINGKINNSPSYIVKVDEEDKIKIERQKEIKERGKQNE